jgi:uncharacterized protein (TIGR03437 family)
MAQIRRYESGGRRQYHLAYGTVGGSLTPAIPAGELVTTTPFPQITAQVTATIGGKAAKVVYAGGAPFETGGVDQIDVASSDGTPSGAAAIVVAIGGISTTKTVTVAVE